MQKLAALWGLGWALIFFGLVGVPVLFVLFLVIAAYFKYALIIAAIIAIAIWGKRGKKNESQ